jgi:hypothetical protein
LTKDAELRIRFQLLDILGRVIDRNHSADIRVLIKWGSCTETLTPSYSASTYSAVYNTRNKGMDTGPVTCTVRYLGNGIGSITIRGDGSVPATDVQYSDFKNHGQWVSYWAKLLGPPGAGKGNNNKGGVSYYAKFKPD